MSLTLVWQCADCRRAVRLDQHGRCEDCGGDAVAASAGYAAPEPVAWPARAGRRAWDWRDYAWFALGAMLACAAAWIILRFG